MACPKFEIPSAMDALIGGSAAMATARAELRRAAAVDSAVLLLGETGTGKGVAARALHEASRRCGGPFVHVDCAALSASVFESELFGHERGAFTGAVARHRGRFERACGGTIFLDEIGELPRALQAKLLTALQDGRLERLGGAEPVSVDVRVVAATNRDLALEVAEGHFRLDLYHRLRVLEIALPPLRSRPDDVAEIVRAHLPALATRVGIESPELTPGFLLALAARSWPGNVRELLHEVERSLVLCPGPVVDAAALAEDALRAPAPLEVVDTVTNTAGDPPAEISRVLRSTGGNVSRAARRLGVSRGTLRYRIAQHGLGSLIPRD